MSEDIGTRLSRWSQRKLAARRSDAVEEAPREDRKPAAPAGPDAAAEQSAAGTPVAAAEDVPVLPTVEELTRDSDYTVFLAKNVPESIKNAALRKLWASDPVFAVLDGLNDYCEDFNATYEPITLAQTAYKAGKGYLDEIGSALEKVAPSADERTDSSGNAAGDSQARIPENDKNAAADHHDTAAAPRVGESADAHTSSGQSENEG